MRAKTTTSTKDNLNVFVLVVNFEIIVRQREPVTAAQCVEL
jgi:hypothetical protein